ncbi:MAG: hypothetical protein HC919_09015 [Oscillatoriales cyanobacterium SM2_2_1]|nr:hypothetical protein [Oscillatoriales cyanobacterium SM2_2_1]
MARNPFQQVGNSLYRAAQWIRRTPERAIAKAYRGAVNIKRIEDEYFDGGIIRDTSGYSASAFSLFRQQLQKNLQIIDISLAEYRLSARLPSLLPTEAIGSTQKPLGNPVQNNGSSPSLAQQLAFIDFILARYRLTPPPSTSTPTPLLDLNAITPTQRPENQKYTLLAPPTARPQTPSVVPIEKTIVPSSFFRAIDRIRRNLGKDYGTYEQDVVEELQQSRQRIKIALRFFVILLGVVISVQIITKNLIVSPLLQQVLLSENTEIKFSPSQEEQAFREFQRVRERLEFERLAAFKVLTNEEFERQLETEARKILQRYNQRSLEGISNLLADGVAGLVCAAILSSWRNQMRVIKEFLDETLYSLNDTSKAFVIIVFTDTFVGYHSSDGWDALLIVLFAHFGIQENQLLTRTFIATVPVFLDGLFKFWIFQYLRQSSPSTAAIFSEMNQ